MKLKKYLNSLPILERHSFSKRCGTTYGHMRNISYGCKTAKESLCINIERETLGLVTCESLRPDVDWEFLRNTSKKKSA